MYETKIIEVFEGLDTSLFRVNLDVRRFFVCGGPVDAGCPIPPSFRDRLISFSEKHYPEISRGIVLAENFNDYFKENAYPDLLTFEEEIASISSLVIIFLESAGSLVELGVFSAKPHFVKKLIIVAPQEDVRSEDSFIFLGPLENLQRREPSSVAVYPWPSDKYVLYDESHLTDLCEAIKEKVEDSPQTVKFNPKSSGHTALLIAEIIRLSYPILKSEIELCLVAIEVEVEEHLFSRLLYLLQKLEFVSIYRYSGYKYYYPAREENAFLRFEQSKKVDPQSARIEITQSFANGHDAQSRKRRNAFKEIRKFLKGEAE